MHTSHRFHRRERPRHHAREWDVDVSGTFDPTVLVGGEQGNANWDEITLKVVLETNASEEEFANSTSEAERRYPITQLFKMSGVDWKSTWESKSL